MAALFATEPLGRRASYLNRVTDTGMSLGARRRTGTTGVPAHPQTTRSDKGIHLYSRRDVASRRWVDVGVPPAGTSSHVHGGEREVGLPSAKPRGIFAPIESRVGILPEVLADVVR